VYTTVFAGSTPIGGLLMGWVASRYGVAQSLVLAGLLCALIGGAAFAWLRRHRAAATVDARGEGRALPAKAPAAAAGSASAARPR
jgi:hypothetical protein